ncbi:MAG: ABC transporter ATP-binding protein, partial [Clostridia bacterium]|nr:ABC transporter ATP-binding protein [Clostridia bacterium]
TGALDSASGAQVLDLFDMLHASGSSIVMITHDRNVAMRADRIRTIRDGVLSKEAEAVKHE